MTLATLLMVAQAAAAGPTPLAPSGPWNLEHHENRCVLSRPFGAGTAQRTFALTSEAFREEPNLIITQADPTSQRGRNFDAQVTIDGQPPVTVKAQSDHVAAVQQRITRVFLDTDLSRAIASARRVRVTSSTFAEDFAPTGMSKAVAAFDLCARDLAKKSGVDLALRDAVAVKAQPMGEVGALFGMNNYPSEARRLNQSGRASVLLTIEADGQVSVCRVTQSSESASLDKTTCDLFLHRSRFKPALDKVGKPMKSQFVTAIRWQLDS